MGDGSNQQHRAVLNLFDYTEDQLLGEDPDLTHYQILNINEYASQDEVKKGFRKASLKYHPDKTGRGEDDHVFLAVKQAYDTLFDHQKRQAYDSTVVPFDDSIPPTRAALLQDELLLYKDEDFYDTFGPVFERNLRFDLRLRPDLNKKNSNNNRSNHNHHRNTKPPHLGDADTPLDQVHKFYEYWVHFESWRDFSAAAADQLQIDQELENAESRYEKRWYQKEIDKRAKQLKRQELNRIRTLVERAMEADPRLRQERADQLAAKQEAAQARERQKQEQIEQEEAERQRQEIIEKERQEQAARDKVIRDQEKKQLRKAKQSLRRMASTSFDEASSANSDGLLWDDAYDMNQDVEFLCSTLGFDGLTKLAEELASADEDALQRIHERVTELRNQDNNNEKQSGETIKSSTVSTTGAMRSDGNSKNNNPWTKDELSALAKAAKKYPPGGSSRWDQICLFINNLCRQDIPRTKEECIEKYNHVTKNPTKAQSNGHATSVNGSATTGETSTTTSTSSCSNILSDAAVSEDEWTAEQDQQLQDALSQYPASIEKNERWTLIATAVPGKSKKQCVQRFKAIREALITNKTTTTTSITNSTTTGNISNGK